MTFYGFPRHILNNDIPLFIHYFLPIPSHPRSIFSNVFDIRLEQIPLSVLPASPTRSRNSPDKNSRNPSAKEHHQSSAKEHHHSPQRQGSANKPQSQLSMDLRGVTGLETGIQAEREDCILQAVAVASKEGEVLDLDTEVRC